jgi:excisionase family DNA binding protein
MTPECPIRAGARDGRSSARTLRHPAAGQKADTAHRATGTWRLVGLAAAAAYADVSTRTLRHYISRGRLTGYRVGPRLIKIDLNELDELARPIPIAREPGTG